MAIRMEIEVVKNLPLLVRMVKRDIRGRYIGSAMGIFWSVINPLIMIAIYVVVFSSLMQTKWKFGNVETGYAVYLCTALLPWLWLQESLIASCNSVLFNGSLLKRTAFPSAILPLEAIIASGVHFIIAMSLFVVVMVFLKAFPGLWTLALIPLIGLQFLLLLGPAYLLATLNVFLRDTQQIVGALLTFLFWATPIVYPQHLVLGNSAPYTTKQILLKYWFLINPVAHISDMYRSILIGRSLPSLKSIAYLVILAGLFYVVGKWLFTRSRRHFIDEL